VDWYLGVLKKYVEFNGRARRTEFWMFALISFGISIALSIVGMMVGGRVLSSIYGLAVLLPSIAVGTRRLHDTNRSGWWQLLWIVPVVGWIVLIVFFVQEGNKGANPYGPDPKAAAPGAPLPTTPA
jgi:uncharacterized membrane protein YhaH (DUF805 family)